MLQPYRTLLRQPGALAFSASGMLARLPISMIPLGLVILVSARTGSYGLAGTVAAAYVIARSACAPLQARLVDRHGQARMLPLLTAVNTVATAGVVVAVEVGMPVPLPHLCAGLAGAAMPAIGSYVRTRWSHLLGQKPALQTAFALEAVLDELIFMIGPPAVTLLATGINSFAGIVLAMVCGLIGTLSLAALRDTQPTAHGRGGRGPRLQPLGWRFLLPVVAASFGIGTLFGAFDISVIALATEQGARAWSGVLLGVTAFGSMLAAVVLGGLQLRRSASVRFRIGTTVLAVAILPLPFVEHLGALGVLVFLIGFTISPTLIANTARAAEIVPTSRLSEGLAWATSAVVGGIALGGALAGPIIDRFDASTGFVVCVAAGVLATLTALADRRPSDTGTTTSESTPFRSGG